MTWKPWLFDVLAFSPGRKGRYTHTLGEYMDMHIHTHTMAYQTPTGPKQAPQWGSDGLWH